MAAVAFLLAVELDDFLFVPTVDFLVPLRRQFRSV